MARLMAQAPGLPWLIAPVSQTEDDVGGIFG